MKRYQNLHCSVYRELFGNLAVCSSTPRVGGSPTLYRECHLRNVVTLLTFMSFAFHPQYSQKEDKYEEEIKVLSDKLKEASFTALTFGV